MMIYSPKLEIIACLSAGGSAVGVISDITVQIVGVPLTALLAAVAGACYAGAYAEKTDFFRACMIAVGWAIAGCTGAPLLQAITIWASKKYLELDLSVPGGFLAFAALLISSMSWWGPKVWPFIKSYLPKRGDK